MKFRENEIVLYDLRPDPRLLFIWFFCKVFLLAAAFYFVNFILIVAIFKFDAVHLDLSKEELWSSIHESLKIVVVISSLYTFLGFLYIYLLRKTYHFYITNERCIFIGGILWYRKRSVPYHKITYAERRQSLFERIFGLSSILVYKIFVRHYQSSQNRGRVTGLIFEGLTESDKVIEVINKYAREAV